MIGCAKGGQRPCQSSTSVKLGRTGSDKAIVRPLTYIGEPQKELAIPWAMQMRAISLEEPSRLVQTLTGAILGCGGWVLSRGANDTGGLNLLFEFERQNCVEIYTVLIASGIELSRDGHIRFTELCLCTQMIPHARGAEIASIDLEIQTYPVERLQPATLCSLE